ncbi:MAG: STAS domain-containing protein [Tissierellia bacterium]|nr:STAS domain-containing protein [Tissierellia bacterium]
MALDISIEFDEKNDAWNVSPRGEIDIYTSPELKKELIERLKERRASLFMDFKDLDYIDSTGLGALISILKIIRDDDKKIYIKNVKPNIRKLFDITDLDKIFIIEG